jgi:hypothetical protein
VDNEVDPGAETVKYNRFNRFGAAKVVTSYADDFPRADVSAQEERQAIKSLGSSYGYSIQEIRAARYANIPLEQRKANAARMAIEEQIDLIAALGDTDNGLTGALNQPNATIYTIANGASGSQLWSTKTGLEINKDLTGIANAIVLSTKTAEMPDTTLIEPVGYGLISSTPLQQGSDTTILEHFLKASPYIEDIDQWIKLVGIGAGATNRMVCYRRDPDALELVIPQEFEQFPPEQHNMDFEIACHARIGGVVLYYPLSMAYGDGY